MFVQRRSRDLQKCTVYQRYSSHQSNCRHSRTVRPSSVGNSHPVPTASDYHKLMSDIPASSSPFRQTAATLFLNHKYYTFTFQYLTHQTLAGLATVDPLLTALKYYIPQFLMLTRLLWITFRTAHISIAAVIPTPCWTVARSFRTGYDTTITGANGTWLIYRTHLGAILNFFTLEHTTLSKNSTLIIATDHHESY